MPTYQAGQYGRSPSSGGVEEFFRTNEFSRAREMGQRQARARVLSPWTPYGQSLHAQPQYNSWARFSQTPIRSYQSGYRPQGQVGQMRPYFGQQMPLGGPLYGNTRGYAEPMQAQWSAAGRAPDAMPYAYYPPQYGGHWDRTGAGYAEQPMQYDQASGASSAAHAPLYAQAQQQHAHAGQQWQRAQSYAQPVQQAQMSSSYGQPAPAQQASYSQPAQMSPGPAQNQPGMSGNRSAQAMQASQAAYGQAQQASSSTQPQQMATGPAQSNMASMSANRMSPSQPQRTRQGSYGQMVAGPTQQANAEMAQQRQAAGSGLAAQLGMSSPTDSATMSPQLAGSMGAQAFSMAPQPSTQMQAGQAGAFQPMGAGHAGQMSYGAAQAGSGLFGGMQGRRAGLAGQLEDMQPGGVANFNRMRGF